ncbi:hypothetical protein SAMN02745166_00054 [Prosthecobacter debontii]|uniref:Uncharacterized protein n=1 Tax=Prosthecobacter debontii TaxID=48467 RepID=A0A1T4WFB7_9BACT|nr:hypothetical protein [Prosthecobacter debontii]SKA75698.1 hypothetical protein SAMN02745166_00054 [Prosthecobacter debontii]
MNASLPSFLVSLILVSGGMLLGVTSGLALDRLTHSWPSWARRSLAVLGTGVTLIPLAALIWSFIGIWTGQWSLPVSSLMPELGQAVPASFQARLAERIWWWLPPVFAVSLPVALLLWTTRVYGWGDEQGQVRRAGLVGLLLLPVVEEVFQMPGAFASLVPLLHGRGGQSASVFLALLPLIVGGALWCWAVWAWPWQTGPFQLSKRDQVREGAVVIGLSPAEVWRRYVLPVQVQRAVAILCYVVAWGTSLWAAYGCPGNAARGQDFHTAYRAALADPLTPLQTALPLTLCALFFWFLGRMVHPRQS